MIISFYDNNIHEAVSTDAYDDEKLRYIYIDREKDLMVASNSRIIVTIPIEFDKQDKVPERIKHLYLSKEMFLYAKKNKCPIIFQEDGIHIGDVVYKYLDIGAYVPYEQFLITDNTEEYTDVLECNVNIKDLLAVAKANVCSSDVVRIKWTILKNNIKLEKKVSLFGNIYDDYDKKIGLIYSTAIIHSLLDVDNNTEENNMQTGEDDGQ